MSPSKPVDPNRELDRKESELVSLTEAITSLHAQKTEQGVLKIYKYTLMGQLGISAFSLTRQEGGHEDILVSHGLKKDSSQLFSKKPLHIEFGSGDSTTQKTFKGTLSIFDHINDSDFQPTQLRFVKTLTQLCLQSIDTIRLQQIEVEQQSIQNELTIARSIQSSLLPDHDIQYDSWDIAWAHVSAKEVGGDVIDIMEDSINDRLVIMIADGAGKGIPGALLMSSVQALFQYLAKKGTSVDEIAHAMNQQLLSSTPSDTFVTATFLELRKPSSSEGPAQITYVNAGHPAGYLIQYSDSEDSASLNEPFHIRSLPSSAPLLGVMEWDLNRTGEWSHTIMMAPRDSMCWVTDGVLEQEIQKPLSVEQKSVGEERCGKWLVEAIGKSPLQATSQNIVDEFISFYQTQVTHEQADDQTLVMLKSAYSTSG